MPKSVWWFEKLMWLTLLIGPAVLWLDWGRLMLKAQQDAGGLSAAAAAAAQVTSIISIAFTFAVLLLLVLLISRLRQNWARWVFLVLLVLGMPFTAFNLPSELSANPVAGALTIVQIVIQVVALALIFVPSARPWFTKATADVPAVT